MFFFFSPTTAFVTCNDSSRQKASKCQFNTWNPLQTIYLLYLSWKKRPWNSLTVKCPIIFFFFDLSHLDYLIGRHSAAVVSTFTSQQKGPGLDYRVFLCGVCMFSLCLHGFLWVFSRYSGFSPKTCELKVSWLIGHSKLPQSVNVSVGGCLSLYVSPVMKQWLVQAAQRPWDPYQDKWMDNCIC